MDDVINESDTMSKARNSPEQVEDTGNLSKISSTAIVKYMQELPLLPYAKLRQDTDLNIAPSNWLRDGRFSKTFPQKRNPLDFSSFGIAHTFLDNIGDVDVISDAENIKKLLKMAYSKAELSLVVHRIGKTLLMDDLDLPALLSYISGNHVHSSDLRWLYEFYCEQRGIPKDGFFKKKKNKHDAKQKNIFSKFLHYSVQQEDNSAYSLTEQPAATASYPTQDQDFDEKPLEHTLDLNDIQDVPEPRNKLHQSSESLQPLVNKQQTPDKSLKKSQGEALKEGTIGHVAPPMSFSDEFFNNSSPSNETSEDDALPEPQQMSSFQRNVLWKFEDLHMLVGTNVPIFGGGKYPAVSLRLRDCGKPINVLTGLDYWLDNLMCNVPEVAMCYHLDGIVQYYDLFKTEDLPQLEGSSFSPKVVKDIAQNVLSFMKSNCTQEGHTYWLFKASDSEVVKLYDLTSICDQKTEEKYQNPFTIPVAMLFYRVAKNMMKQDALHTGDQSIVKLLLDNCVLLLDNETFPEIITSANLLLSSLYSPDNIHTLPSADSNSDSRDNLQEDSTADDKTENPIDVMASKGSLEVRELSTPGMYQDDIRQVAKMITSNTEERCKKALSHIVEGLRSLSQGLCTDQEAEEMDDIKNDGSKASFSVRRITTLSPSYSLPPSGHGSDEGDKNPLLLVKPVQWRAQSKMLLLRKATSVYHSMACLSNTKGKYGRGLRYCKLSFQCLQAYRAFGMQKHEEDFELIRSINCACADSYLMLAKCENLDVHHDDFCHGSTDDSFIAQAASESGDEMYSAKVEFKFNAKDNLMTSADLYVVALDLTGKGTKEDEFLSLARRVGNVKNELGVYFMNQAVSMAEHGIKLSKQRDFWKKSFAFFESGIKAFESIDDRANMALLYSNSGRLMRLCAQAVGGRVGTSEPSMKEFSSEEKAFYKQSIDFYNRALQSLSERKVCAEVWDTVTWELSGACFTMATLLQDFPPLSMLSQQEVEKEVTELMMKALKICEPTGKGSLATVRPHSSLDLEKRIGSIHHRLASLYHNAYRNEISDHVKKKDRSLADLHYTKACLNYKPDIFPCEWIRINLERVAMCEHQLALHNSGSNASFKTLDSALEFILKCREALVTLTGVDQKSKEKDENVREREIGEINISGKESNEIGNVEEKKAALEVCNPTDSEAQGYKGIEENVAQTSREVDRECSSITETVPYSTFMSELKVLIPILDARLHSILKDMVKLRSSKKSGKNKGVNLPELEKAKQMYSVALKGCATNTSLNYFTKGKQLADVLAKISSVKHDNAQS